MNFRVLIVGILLTTTHTWAQKPELVRSRICTRCSVQLQPVARIAGSEEHGGVVGSDYLPRDSRDRYYHTNNDTPAQIQVFDSVGRVIKVIGKAGSGPGEFSDIGFIAVGRGDSLHVFDIDSRRYT